jgi:hypothetical protein
MQGAASLIREIFPQWSLNFYTTNGCPIAGMSRTEFIFPGKKGFLKNSRLLPSLNRLWHVLSIAYMQKEKLCPTKQQ